MEFGISLDPSSVPQRHALYDSDEEDEQADLLKADFTFQPPPDSVHIHKNYSLVVAIGPVACIFAKSHFVLAPLLTLEASTRAIFQGMHFPKNQQEPCLVSEFMEADGGDVVFCLHEKCLKLEQVNTWSKKVFEMLNPSRVFVLTSRSNHTHFSPHYTSPEAADLSEKCFLRSVCTSSWTDPLYHAALPLEAPNTLSGETAAILTECQLQGTPGAAAVLYTYSSQTTSEQVTEFSVFLDPVFDHLSITALTKRSPNEVAKIVKTLQPKPREDLSTLYT